MLILPLHRRFTRQNFPWVTLALVLINCLVFFALQGRDAGASERAFQFYAQSGLGAIEFPAYRDWLQVHPDTQRSQMLEAWGEAAGGLPLQLIQSDDAFLAELRADRIITAQAAGYDAWKSQRSEFDRLWDRRFTDRHVLRYSEIDPARMFSAMFLHGGFGHLLGNMIFLVMLGLLVEGALGPALFLGLYLAGGMGASAASLAYRWGDVGAMLGASGAIAALMGAYCVLWGLRKVRFFWWFFVVFDYVRAPALLLLPFWLGWELFNLAFNGGAHVGFDAHAGGIVSGALLAYAVRSIGWERREFLDEDEKVDRQVQAGVDLKQALAHLGKLEIGQARSLLERLNQEGPGAVDVRIALYRCARYSNNNEELHKAARRALDQPLADAVTMRKLKSVFDDYRKASADKLRLEPALLLNLARAWLRIGADADAERVLRDLISTQRGLNGLVEAWWEFARRAPEASPEWRARLQILIEAFPTSAAATKARFLLAEAALQ